MGRVGFVYDPKYLGHEMGRSHPESPERLRAICTQLQASGTWSRLQHVLPRRAERQWIELIHRSSYVDSLERRSPANGYASLDPDTSMSPGTLDAAYLATGGALAAVDAMMNDEIDQAFAPCVPLGTMPRRIERWGRCIPG